MKVSIHGVVCDCSTITELMEVFNSMEKTKYPTKVDPQSTTDQTVCDFMVVNYETHILNILKSERNTPSVYDLRIIDIINYTLTEFPRGATEKYRNNITEILEIYKNREN